MCDFVRVFGVVEDFLRRYTVFVRESYPSSMNDRDDMLHGQYKTINHHDFPPGSHLEKLRLTPDDTSHIKMVTVKRSILVDLLRCVAFSTKKIDAAAMAV